MASEQDDDRDHPELSQIKPQDLIYVLKGGSVVEQGFRGDLEAELAMDEEGGKGELRRMMASDKFPRVF